MWVNRGKPANPTCSWSAEQGKCFFFLSPFVGWRGGAVRNTNCPFTVHSVCVCVCLLPIYSGRQVSWMYQPGSHRRKVTQDFSSTFLLRRMTLFFSREGFSRSFPSSTVKSNFVYERFNRSPLVGHFYFYFYFLVRKNPSYRDSNLCPNVSEGYEVTN